VSQARFEIKESKDGQWYWHLLAVNGEIVAVGETHPTPAAAKGAAETVIRLIRELPEEPEIAVDAKPDQPPAEWDPNR
jgi:uncharacterized protein YegP (UPF0339 family)